MLNKLLQTSYRAQVSNHPVDGVYCIQIEWYNSEQHFRDIDKTKNEITEYLRYLLSVEYTIINEMHKFKELGYTYYRFQFKTHIKNIKDLLEKEGIKSEI